MSLVTRCPACSTMFKVVPDQIRIAAGWVRCGHCGEVFDASAHMLPYEPSPQDGKRGQGAPSASPAPEPPKASLAPIGSTATGAGAGNGNGLGATVPGQRPGASPPSSGAGAVSMARMLTQPTAPAEPAPPKPPTARGPILPPLFTRPAPVPAPASAPSSAAGIPAAAPVAQAPTAVSPAPSAQPITGSETGAHLAWPELPSLDRSADAAAAGASTPAAAPSTSEAPTKPATPSREPQAPAVFPSARQELGAAVVARAATDALAVEPKAADAPALTPQAELTPIAAESAGAPAADAAPIATPSASADDKSPPADEPEPPSQDEAALAPTVEPESPARAEKAAPDEKANADMVAVPEAEPSFVKDAQRRALWSSRPVRIVLWLAAVLLLLGLALQVTLSRRDLLAARQPGLVPLLETLCAPLGCHIQPYRQLDAIVIDASAFNRVSPNSFRFSVTLRNSADLPVASPALELTLTDAQDQALVRRVVTPAELGAPPALAARGEFSGVNSLTVADLANPGAVVGYRLTAFYP